ncbi:MAG: hypothetical protein NXH83_19490 [Rhodobacteraceae bacterium]|nr:hypothetical protein [Paracoccaceae bacterium]
MRSATRIILACVLAVAAGAASAQESMNIFRLPPSVGATPIEIP